jgi:Zn ribbon nucleic-acid-binding protein
MTGNIRHRERDECPVCEEEDTVRIIQGFDVAKCINCGYDRA